MHMQRQQNNTQEVEKWRLCKYHSIIQYLAKEGRSCDKHFFPLRVYFPLIFQFLGSLSLKFIYLFFIFYSRVKILND